MNSQNTEDLHSRALPSRDTQEDRHRLWQEMQDAYNVYLSTSEALADFSQSQLTAPYAEKGVEITSLEGQQRAAFENYIDARLHYAEFGRDEDSILSIGPRSELRDRQPKGRDRGKSLDRLLLATANILLLVMIGLSSMSLVREERRVQGALRAREQMSATVARTESDIPHSRLKPESSAKIATPGASAKSTNTDIKLKKKTKPGRDSNVRALNRGYYEFTLIPSARPQRVGPVSLSIRQVDPKRKSLTLSIIAGRRIDEKQIRLNVPVWIAQADSMVLMKLVATSVDAQHVRGYLVRAGGNVELSSNRSRAGLRSGAWN